MQEFRISTDKSELDIPLIQRFIARESYWARGIPIHIVQRSIEHSLCFAGFLGPAQVAFARVITDYATFAYLGDVFVLQEHRGKGYSKALVAAVVAHPGLQGLRRFMLSTSDAHGLYAQFGFSAPGHPESLMERYQPDVYAING